MRLFIAINFSPEIKTELITAMNKMKTQGVSGNFTKGENLHLTLAFIGEANTAEPIKKIMDKILLSKFSLTIKGSGNFRDILWAGIEKNKNLQELAYSIQNELRKNGYNIEKRDFKPHITLVRQAICDKNVKPQISEVSMEVKCISLMKSERINGKLTYTEIHRTNLD